jgi:hypothetical protein
VPQALAFRQLGGVLVQHCWDDHGTRARRAGRLRLVWALPLLLCAALAITYSYVIPLGYGPDEPRHYAFVRLLWVHHQLPRLLPDGSELGNATVYHPPTYYLLEGLLWYPGHWLGRVAAPALTTGLARRLVIGVEPVPLPSFLLPDAVTYRLMRFTSVGWGVASLALVLAALRTLWPHRPAVALSVGLLLALWPHAAMNFATITNDVAANLVGALFVWYWACRAPQGPGDWRHAARAGAITGLGAMMKAQLLLCLTPVMLVGLALPYGRSWWKQRQWWTQAAVALLVLMIIAGPWYARNLCLYGQINYVAPGYRIIPPGLTVLDALLVGLLGRALRAVLGGLFRSIWAQVGWFPAAVAPQLYLLLGLLVLAAVAGWIRIALHRRRHPSPLDPFRARALCCLLLPYPAIFLLNVYVALFVHFGTYEGGRYHLFALPGLATLLVKGWLGLGRRGGVVVAGLGLFVLLNALSIYNLLTYLNPTYATTVLVGQ